MDRWTELALVAHEVGGALTPARNAATLLREDPPRGMDSRQQRLLSMILRSLERTDRVLGNLNSIALPENYEDQLEICRPHAWMPDWIAPYNHEAEERNLRLDLDVVDGMPGFPTDLFLLEQVLGNLVSNALKFTPAGGRVRVSAAPCRGAVLPGKMLLLAGGFGFRPRFLQIAVEDTGLGLSPDTRRRLFQPFFRGEEAAKHAGTGLGLTVSRRLTGLLHGDLRADESSQGARFVLTLPADAATRTLSGSIDALYAHLRQALEQGTTTVMVARLPEADGAETVSAWMDSLCEETDSKHWRISPTTWVVVGSMPVRNLYRKLAARVAQADANLQQDLHVHARRARRGENVDEVTLQSVVRCRQSFPIAVLQDSPASGRDQTRTEVA